MDSLLNAIFQGILEGDADKVVENVQASLVQSTDPGAILQDSMIPAMQEVGRLYEEGEYYVPEMLVAARAMQAGLGVLKPHLAGSSYRSAGKVVVGTVRGDLHDIGKNLVAMMLEGAAFEVIDLGTDVTPEKFVEAVQTHSPVVLGMSALLTTTMPNMEKTIQALQQAGVRSQVKVIVGGAPLTESYAQQIGADGYASDASRAVSLAKKLVGIA